MSDPVFESRLPVGSSAKTTVGRETSARAIATRCCWPPESSAGRCLRRCGEADAVEQVLEELRIGLLAGDRERQQDVLLGREHRQQVEELEDEADVLAAQERHGAIGQRADVLARDLDLPGGRLVERREQVHQGRLARARRPHHGHQLAAVHLQRHPAQRVDRGLTLAVAAGEVRCAHNHSVRAHVGEATENRPRARHGVCP